MVVQASLLSVKSSCVGGKYSLEPLSVSDHSMRDETSLRNEFLIGGHILELKVAEDDTLQLSDIRSNEEFSHFFDGIFSGISTGITVDSGADSGKSNALHIIFDCQLQTASVARSKERDGVVLFSVDWADRVDYTLAGQFVGGGDLCIASVTSIKMVAFLN